MVVSRTMRLDALARAAAADGSGQDVQFAARPAPQPVSADAKWAFAQFQELQSVTRAQAARIADLEAAVADLRAAVGDGSWDG